MSKAIERRDKLVAEYKELISKPNAIDTTWDNGIYDRYVNPVITPEHIPLSWRYDLNPETNPHMMERLGINATLNPGAIKWNGKFVVCVRIEGYDRKSFFGLAESENGIDNFKFIGKPIQLDQVDRDDTNVYDMRLVKHEDGYVYGLFCSERKDLSVPESDTSTAEAQCGLVRTNDLLNWERLPDLKSPSAQQRNVVLHPEFIDGKYALYTRPQDGFIETGKGGGIGWGLCEDMTNPVIEEETVIHGRSYHTVYEVKNGMGPAPIKTDKGWLQLAHGVRNTAAGLRYVLYMFLSDLEDPTKIIAVPGGHFMAPQKSERVGDVSNVLFSNGWIKNDDGTVNIYYASSDTLCHVATTTVDKLLDYVLNTPADPLASHLCVNQRCELIDKNDAIAKELGV